MAAVLLTVQPCPLFASSRSSQWLCSSSLMHLSPSSHGMLNLKCILGNLCSNKALVGFCVCRVALPTALLSPGVLQIYLLEPYPQCGSELCDGIRSPSLSSAAGQLSSHSIAPAAAPAATTAHRVSYQTSRQPSPPSSAPSATAANLTAAAAAAAPVGHVVLAKLQLLVVDDPLAAEELEGLYRDIYEVAGEPLLEQLALQEQAAAAAAALALGSGWVGREEGYYFASGDAGIKDTFSRANAMFPRDGVSGRSGEHAMVKGFSSNANIISSRSVLMRRRRSLDQQHPHHHQQQQQQHGMLGGRRSSLNISGSSEAADMRLAVLAGAGSAAAVNNDRRLGTAAGADLAPRSGSFGVGRVSAGSGSSASKGGYGASGTRAQGWDSSDDEAAVEEMESSSSLVGTFSPIYVPSGSSRKGQELGEAQQGGQGRRFTGKADDIGAQRQQPDLLEAEHASSCLKPSFSAEGMRSSSRYAQVSLPVVPPPGPVREQVLQVAAQQHHWFPFLQDIAVLFHADTATPATVAVPPLANLRAGTVAKTQQQQQQQQNEDVGAAMEGTYGVVLGTSSSSRWSGDDALKQRRADEDQQQQEQQQVPTPAAIRASSLFVQHALEGSAQGWEATVASRVLQLLVDNDCWGAVRALLHYLSEDVTDAKTPQQQQQQLIFEESRAAEGLPASKQEGAFTPVPVPPTPAASVLPPQPAAAAGVGMGASNAAEEVRAAVRERGVGEAGAAVSGGTDVAGFDFAGGSAGDASVGDVLSGTTIGSSSPGAEAPLAGASAVAAAIDMVVGRRISTSPDKPSDDQSSALLFHAISPRSGFYLLGRMSGIRQRSSLSSEGSAFPWAATGGEGIGESGLGGGIAGGAGAGGPMRQQMLDSNEATAWLKERLFNAGAGDVHTRSSGNLSSSDQHVSSLGIASRRDRQVSRVMGSFEVPVVSGGHVSVGCSLSTLSEGGSTAAGRSSSSLLVTEGAISAAATGSTSSKAGLLEGTRYDESGSSMHGYGNRGHQSEEWEQQGGKGAGDWAGSLRNGELVMAMEPRLQGYSGGAGGNRQGLHRALFPVTRTEEFGPDGAFPAGTLTAAAAAAGAVLPAGGGAASSPAARQGAVAVAERKATSIGSFDIPDGPWTESTYIPRAQAHRTPPPPSPATAAASAAAGVGEGPWPNVFVPFGGGAKSWTYYTPQGEGKGQGARTGGSGSDPSVTPPAAATAAAGGGGGAGGGVSQAREVRLFSPIPQGATSVPQVIPQGPFARPAAAAGNRGGGGVGGGQSRAREVGPFSPIPQGGLSAPQVIPQGPFARATAAAAGNRGSGSAGAGDPQARQVGPFSPGPQGGSSAPQVIPQGPFARATAAAVTVPRGDNGGQAAEAEASGGAFETGSPSTPPEAIMSSGANWILSIPRAPSVSEIPTYLSPQVIPHQQQHMGGRIRGGNGSAGGGGAASGAGGMFPQVPGPLAAGAVSSGPAAATGAALLGGGGGGGSRLMRTRSAEVGGMHLPPPYQQQRATSSQQGVGATAAAAAPFLAAAPHQHQQSRHSSSGFAVGQPQTAAAAGPATSRSASSLLVPDPRPLPPPPPAPRRRPRWSIMNLPPASGQAILSGEGVLLPCGDQGTVQMLSGEISNKLGVDWRIQLDW